MSIVHCDYCDRNINTDYNAEHFIDGTEHCLEKVRDFAPELLEALEKLMEAYNDKGQLLDFNINIARQAIKKAVG